MLSPEQMAQQVLTRFPSVATDERWMWFAHSHTQPPLLFDVRHTPNSCLVQSADGIKGVVDAKGFREEPW